MRMFQGSSGRPVPASVGYLPRLIELLCVEHGLEVRVPAEPRAQWDMFRALVNTRPPASAAAELLALQDELLRDIIAWRGITDAREIPASARDDRLALWRGDITTLRADAIVNAANAQMLGCFVPGHRCIDNAIHTFAGKQLRLACDRLMRGQGCFEPTSTAKVTEAFNLTSERIIHTVGPIASGALSDADRAALAACYRSCLEAAGNAGCKTIAFCCISTGVFGFPQDEAAAIAVDTVVGWLDGHPDAPLERVVFDVFADRDLELYQELLA
ncbi:protein-ADP-ribose hydrolase [Collinsella tanakaei]|uniref:protein-ADP-ribose hydrolase n=1 Tax=Collinsella tanakaei TaxID=626935 RepID=UPI0039F60709